MTPGEAVTALGYVAGFAVLVLAAGRARLLTEGMGVVAAAALAGGVLGARLAEWVLAHPGMVAAHPQWVLNPHYGGRTVLGGVLGGWGAVEVAKARLGIRRSTGDLFALAIPTGEAVGRIGCHLNGCCYGVASNLPWAVWQHGAWRQPAQLYSTVVCAALALALWRMRPLMRAEGELFCWFLLLYAGQRFLLEFARDHTHGWLGLSLAQWICLEMLAVGAVSLWRRRCAPAPVPLAATA